ncbi:MAG: lipopolysaccharide biosynthesis protein [Candidatus Marinimicrobia bacterium]|nr:lipopolysaccharide biosynthesis protein [Candidatus Neomarinimicrobiota bacterium]
MFNVEIGAPSIKKRAIVSILANFLYMIINFITGIIVARKLGPSNYGNFTFLIGVFIGFRELLELGTSKAFYTFISQKKQTIYFYIVYFLWQILQFIGVIILIAIILPQKWVNIIWQNHDKSLIILAFIATFSKNQGWQTIIYIGESLRKTIVVQLMNVSVGFLHFLFILILISINKITISNLFIIIIVEYVTISLISLKVLEINNDCFYKGKEPLVEIVKKYYAYCSPLVLLYIMSFLNIFFDKWLLQHFGGSIQQGFFSVSQKLGMISLLVTSSIIKIFWKEISEANKNNDKKKLFNLYRKTSRLIYFVGAVITCFLLMWTKYIVLIVLGPDYKDAYIPLGIMLFYPIHQSLGQINSAMFLATEKTKKYMSVVTFFLLLGIPVSYIFIASSSSPIPGLELGSIGLTIKMVLLQFIAINAQIILISKMFKWKIDVIYQLNVILLIIFAYSSKKIVEFGFSIFGFRVNIIFVVLIAGVIYLVFIYLLLYFFPNTIQMERNEFRKYLKII